MKNSIQLTIDIITLITLIVTAAFVIKYWEETQEMKNEMVRQNKIISQSQKISLLPLIDVQFEQVKSDPYPVDFTYDIFLINKGNGPAFKVFVKRLPIPNENRQKTALRPATRGNLKPFTKNIPMIGRGERVKIHRERSDSYEYVRIEVAYWDHFGDLHKISFVGDRDKLRLKEHPLIESY